MVRFASMAIVLTAAIGCTKDATTTKGKPASDAKAQTVALKITSDLH